MRPRPSPRSNCYRWIDLSPGLGQRVIQRFNGGRALALILPRVDKPLGLARWPLVLVIAFFADHTSQQALLVVRVKDLEIFR